MPLRSQSLPPPTGGWDTRESLADMPIESCVICDNFFPSTDKVGLRRGNEAQASGIGGPVETLIEHIDASGTGRLFAAGNGKIFEVTNKGAVAAALVSGLTSDRWQAVRMGTAAGNFTRLVNGSDTPMIYNGTAWGTTPAITGVDAPSDLIWVNVHQNRLWTGEKDSLTAHYLPVNSVGGALSPFNLAGVAKLGGFIMAMGTWTRDAGDGMDDVAVFLTSEGEAIVYQGTDPTSPNTWSLIGVFRIGKPIGRRCFVQGGPDLILVTQDGFVPLSGVLSLDRSQTAHVALSGQISKAVNDAVRTHGTLFGWQPILYPFGTMLIFNIPQSATTAHQYVFNTITGAPCRFTGINALCFSLLNDQIYWGGADGTVNRFDIGATDLGEPIQADCVQAFSYFGAKANKKIFKQIEVVFEGTGPPGAAVGLNFDFRIEDTVPIQVEDAPGMNVWGVGKWGIATWSSVLQVYDGWRKTRGIGRAAAIRVRIGTRSPGTSWIATNINFVLAGRL